MINKQHILIYNDTGTSENSVKGTIASLSTVVDLAFYEIITVNKHIVNNTAWERNTVLFIMPGGRSNPFYVDLAGRNKGNQKIKQYVEDQQGNYMGICAGGYYGCNKTEFEIGYPLEICCAGILNFYNGTAFGPAYGLGQFSYENNDSAKISNIALFNLSDEKIDEYQIYYNGGACFIPDTFSQNNSIVLARYMDIPKSPIAIVHCKAGAGGNVILTGIHPEFSFREVAAQHHQDVNIYRVLKVTDLKRLYLFAYLIFRLGLKLNPLYQELFSCSG